MAKQMVEERQDITGLNCIKGASGKVIVDDKGIKDSWKEYMQKLMNEENEWDHKISAEVKEGPADCIKMDEVRAVLKKNFRVKGKKLYFGFVDLEKAFDRVPREVISWAMRKLVFEEWLVSAVMSMYTGAKTVV